MDEQAIQSPNLSYLSPPSFPPPLLLSLPPFLWRFWLLFDPGTHIYMFVCCVCVYMYVYQ